MIKGEKVKIFYSVISFLLFLLACRQVKRGIIEFNIVVVIPLIITFVLILSYFWNVKKRKK